MLGGTGMEIDTTDSGTSSNDTTTKSVEELKAIVNNASNISDSKEEISQTESAIYELATRYTKNGQANELKNLIESIRPFLKLLSKAKAGKLLRKVVGQRLDMKDASRDEAVTLCEDTIKWCVEEKRSFLRQALESRLIGLLLEAKRYSDSLILTDKLVKELKRLDDKALLVEVQLLESRAYYHLRNGVKARSALTSARTSANAIYCPPSLQGSLDLQSGVLHGEEKDFKTAYSYFYEAFENYDSIEHELALSGLKYMLLAKIMLNLPNDVHSIISGKLALKYSGPQIDAMRAVATAHHNRSLEEFEKVLAQYKTELTGDPIIETHLNDLYNSMLENNLCRIIEPFSCVEIAHLAHLIKLPAKVVEDKLSKMILDRKFVGILDQGAGCLMVYDEAKTDPMYGSTKETIEHMGKVVDLLYKKASKLS